MIAEEDFKIKEKEHGALDPNDYTWYYSSVKMVNQDEVFCLCAIEKDNSVILRYPIKVTMHKDPSEEGSFHLRWAVYNPFTSDEFTRIKSDQVFSINFLNDRFRKTYKLATAEKYGETKEEIEEEEKKIEESEKSEVPEEEFELAGEKHPAPPADPPKPIIMNKKLH